MAVIAKAIPTPKLYTTGGDLEVTIPTTRTEDGGAAWTPAANEKVLIVASCLSTTVEPTAPAGFTPAGVLVTNQWGARVRWFYANATSVTPGAVVTIPYSGAAQNRKCILYVADQCGALQEEEPGGHSATSTTPTFQAFTKADGTSNIFDAAECRASQSNVAVSMTVTPAAMNTSDTIGTNDTTTASYRNGLLFAGRREVTGTSVIERTGTTNISTDWATTRVAFAKVSATIAPTVNAGADTSATVNTAAFTRTATENLNGGSAISSRLWTQVSGPSTALAGTTTATVTITPPSVTGVAVYRYTATNVDGQAGSDDFAVTYSAAGQVLRPAADVSKVGWTGTPNNTSLAANIDEAVADVADYISSPDNPSNSRYVGTLTTGFNPGTGADVRLRALVWLTAGTSTHTVTLQLIQGPGDLVVASRDFTDVTSTASWREVVLTTEELAAVSDWNNLRFGVVATAA